MSIISIVKKRLFKRNNNNVLVYDETLKQAYLSFSVTSSKLKGVKMLLIHNGGNLSFSIKERLDVEKACLCSINIEEGFTNVEQEVDVVLVVIEWSPIQEMMRLKSISKETYYDFFSKYVDRTTILVRSVLENCKAKKLIVALPAFSFEKEYGFTLYGIAAQHMECSFESLARSTGTKFLNIHYAKVLNAKPSAKSSINFKDGSLHHVLLCEQVAAILSFISGPHGDSIEQRCISVGIGGSTGMSNIINKVIYNNSENSTCGGALADRNVLIVYNDERAFGEFQVIFEKEGSFVYGLRTNADIDEASLLLIEGKMIGFVDNIVNIVNTSKVDNPIALIYRWFQIESPFLTKYNRKVSINTIVLSNSSVIRKEFMNLIGSLAYLLGNNHSFVVNGIFAKKDSIMKEVAATSAFLSSKYGEALIGETMELN